MMQQPILRKKKKIYSVIRYILITAIACNLAASLLVLSENVWTELTSEALDLFVWYSFIGGMYSIVLSALVLTNAYFRYRRKKRPVWKTFRVEYFLVMGTIACLVVLRICIELTF